MSIGFDQLAKGLAGGVSRRQVLKLIGGTMGGSFLATTTGFDTAVAAPSSCAVFCGKTSFISGPAHASCLQACNKCGGDITRVCQGPTGSVCCAPGTSCCFGPTGAFCCPSGTICTGNGTCLKPRSFCVPTCGTDTCAAGSGTSCNTTCAGATVGCSCVSTIEGSACVQEVCTFVTCATSADCGAGAVCFTQGCCGA
jgi:hypothetical protein